VPGMRNPYGPAPLLQRAFVDNADLNPQLPGAPLPALLPRSRPLHEVVPVDVFLPGCPPHADLIYAVLDDLLEGRVPDTSGVSRFGR